MHTLEFTKKFSSFVVKKKLFFFFACYSTTAPQLLLVKMSNFAQKEKKLQRLMSKTSMFPISDLVFHFASFGFPIMKLALQPSKLEFPIEIGNVEVLDMVFFYQTYTYRLLWHSLRYRYVCLKLYVENGNNRRVSACIF